MDRLVEYLRHENVPLVMKMNELARNGPTGDFLNLWKIIRVLAWKKRSSGGLSEQETAAMEKLRKMAGYYRRNLSH